MSTRLPSSDRLIRGEPQRLVACKGRRRSLSGARAPQTADLRVPGAAAVATHRLPCRATRNGSRVLTGARQAFAVSRGPVGCEAASRWDECASWRSRRKRVARARRPPSTSFARSVRLVSAAHPTRHARSRASRGSLAAGSRRYSWVEWPPRAGYPLDDVPCATRAESPRLAANECNPHTISTQHPKKGRRSPAGLGAPYRQLTQRRR